MAQKVVVQLIDDLNGKEAQETILFGLDGENLEIDLTTENAKTLREELSQYIIAGRRVKSSYQRRKSSELISTKNSKYKNIELPDPPQLVRIWAKKNGIETRSTGRIPSNVLAQYEEWKKEKVRY